MSLEVESKLLNPISTRNIRKNNGAVRSIRDITSLVFGIGAGILRLESYVGFGLYLLAFLITTLLMFVLITEGTPSKYFENPITDFWLGDLVRGISSYVLTWTLIFGLVDM